MKPAKGKDGMKTYILKHKFGENWSLYHTTVVESIFHDILQKLIHVSNTESTLTQNQNNTYLPIKLLVMIYSI
jgi:hypothetical protein